MNINYEVDGVCAVFCMTIVITHAAISCYWNEKKAFFDRRLCEIERKKKIKFGRTSHRG